MSWGGGGRGVWIIICLIGNYIFAFFLFNVCALLKFMEGFCFAARPN